MSSDERERQALQFLDFHRRRGGDWEGTFSAWSSTKDFQPADRRAIRRLAEAELIASGVAVITDLDYAPPPAPALNPGERAERAEIRPLHAVTAGRKAGWNPLTGAERPRSPSTRGHDDE